MKEKTNILKSTWFWLMVIVAVGGFLRFYKLDWGDGYFFHPDERNIVDVVLKIQPPFNRAFFTQGTFAYGSFVPYLVYGIKSILSNITYSTPIIQETFSSIALTLRLISTVSSFLTIPLVFLIGRKYWNHFVGLFAALLVSFSPGLIQAAHFGTFESLLTLLFTLVLFFTLRLFESGKTTYLWLSILILSVSMAIKVNSILLLPIPLLVYLFFHYKVKKSGFLKRIFFVFLSILLFIILTFIFSPYYLTADFWRMLEYENSLVRGAFDVFYTRQFHGTVPILFQFVSILPYIFHPLIFLFPVLFFLTPFILIKERSRFFRLTKSHLLFFFLAILFIPNAFLYTKWTRYIVISLPFFALSTVIVIFSLFRKHRYAILFWLSITSILWGLAFFSIYTKQDVRIQATDWMYSNLNKSSVILSETANVHDLPLYLNNDCDNHLLVSNFDFYNLERNSYLFSNLLRILESSDYILVPSRRIFGGMGQHPQFYPRVGRYYQLLFSGDLGFEEVKQFTSYPRIGKIEFPDEIAEETWTVFDHPVVRVYKKVRPYSAKEYEELLAI